MAFNLETEQWHKTSTFEERSWHRNSTHAERSWYIPPKRKPRRGAFDHLMVNMRRPALGWKQMYNIPTPDEMESRAKHNLTMSAFLSLPVEIHLTIVSEIDLDDIENFTLCCKRFRQLSKKRLIQQFERKRRNFHTIAVGNFNNETWDEDEQIRGVHPILALQKVLSNGGACLHAKTLILGDIGDFNSKEPPSCDWETRVRWSCERHAGVCDPEEGEIAEDDLHTAGIELMAYNRLYKKCLDVLQFTDPALMEVSLEDCSEGLESCSKVLKDCPKADIWARSILKGNKDAAAGLLISILPNLQKVRLVDEFLGSEGTSFPKILKKLFYSIISGDPIPEGVNSFSNLTDVGMIGLGSPKTGDFGILSQFMLLPSLNAVKGRAIDGLSLSRLPSTEEPLELTSFEVHRSVIRAEFFEDVLPALESLETFVYEFWTDAGHDIINHLTRWQPRRIVAALWKHNRKTLEHLELTCFGETLLEYQNYLTCVNFSRDEPFIESLTGFEVLKTVRLEALMLYKEAWDPDGLVERERLADFLPASIRRVRLVGSLSKEDVSAMLEDFAEGQHEILSNLTTIFFEDIERSEVDEAVVKECESAGVKMRFYEPSV